MAKGNVQLTVENLRELCEKEFLTTIKSEIEAVKVQKSKKKHSSKQSSLSSKYDNLLVATQGAN